MMLHINKKYYSFEKISDIFENKVKRKSNSLEFLKYYKICLALYFDCGAIEEIGKVFQTLYKLKNLKFLIFDYANLGRKGLIKINKLPKIKQLYVSYDNIKNITKLKQHKKLKVIHFRKCNIKKIPKISNFLKNVNFRKNKIKKININSFSLNFLNLVKNKIKRIIINSPNVKEINTNFNNLIRI